MKKNELCNLAYSMQSYWEKTRIFFYKMAVFLDVHVTDIKIKQFTITFERIDLQSWPLYVFSLFFHAEHNEHSKNQFQTFWKFCGGHLGFFHDLNFLNFWFQTFFYERKKCSFKWDIKHGNSRMRSKVMIF